MAKKFRKSFSSSPLLHASDFVVRNFQKKKKKSIYYYLLPTEKELGHGLIFDLIFPRIEKNYSQR